MSRSPHAQLGRKVRRLPVCTKCRKQFYLVQVSYKDKESTWEWECDKCGKIVPKDSITIQNKEETDEWHKFLHNWCKRQQRRDDS